MSQIKDNSKDNNLDSWSQDVINVSLTSWEEMPDIGLYMDQVLILMEKYLGNILITEGKDGFITPSMINNYVKLGVMPAPQSKRYSKEHLVYLIIICLMKQSLSISSIKSIIEMELTKMKIDELYVKFCLYYEEYLKCIIKNQDVNLSSSNIDDNILKLGIISNICRLVSDNSLRIIENEKKRLQEVLDARNKKEISEKDGKKDNKKESKKGTK